jgi:hypothetical protein
MLIELARLRMMLGVSAPNVIARAGGTFKAW